MIGTTGTGKTTLLLRLWAGFMATALSRQAAGTGRRPLLVVLDCKGGADSRRIADRTRRVLRDAGARATAIWPDDANLSLWDLPPGRLTTTLLDLIEHGHGAAAYYTDVMEAIVALAVHAPPAPPADSADFLGRLDADWLATAYAGGDEDALAALRSGAHLIPDVALRFRSLWRRLGTGFEPAGSFADADAWYCILEGTAETSVAEAQARALVDMLASYITGPGRDADVLLAVDEFSAVARRLPIWALYERARSLGLAVQVSAQSWPGLAADEDERYRIAATAEGGIWLLRTPYPDPVVGLAGTRKYVDSTRRLVGAPSATTGPVAATMVTAARWSDEGSSRVQLMPVVDPDLVRGLGVGQAAYVYQGGATYVQVKRLVAAPAALCRCPRSRRRHTGGSGPTGRPCRLGWPRTVGTAAGGAERFPGRGIRPGGMVSGPDPFAILGLAARPDLTDDDVRAAWRRIAAAVHPDRADGGDPARFSAAAAAYTTLRTLDGRREAFADLAAAPRGWSRFRRGRPAVLVLRTAVAAGVSAGALVVAGPQPASFALIAGALTWLARTGRHELAPPAVPRRRPHR